MELDPLAQAVLMAPLLAAGMWGVMWLISVIDPSPDSGGD